jgi:hypothetical protein
VRYKLGQNAPVNLMQNDRWLKLEQIFNEVVTISPEAREIEINLLCQTDSTMRDEIVALLNAAEMKNNFLDEPVFALGTKILASEENDDF